MLMLLSPAKSLDFENKAPTKKFTQPEFIADSSELIESLKAFNPEHIQELMKVSSKIADLNYQRFQNWQPKFDLNTAKQCAFAFQGDVYQGLEITQFKSPELAYAQRHLRILSGLYGLLKPLDLIHAYRLEMGTKLSNGRGKNLYEFWGDKLSQAVNAQQKKINSQALVNLASNEYFKALQPSAINTPIITPVFKDFKNGQHKIISFYAKKARGLMAAYAIRHGLKDAEDLKDFSQAGYYFNPEQSTDTQWIFLRDAQQ